MKNKKIIKMLLATAMIFGVGAQIGAASGVLPITGINHRVNAEEEVYKKALFGTSYNSKGVSSYSSEWSATNDDFTVNLINFNNNNNGWSYIKAGNKNTAYIAKIITNNVLDKIITSVSLKIDAITANNINSIKLYMGDTSNCDTYVGDFDKSVGNKTISISNQSKDKYYAIVIDCKAASNGSIQISQVTYNIEQEIAVNDSECSVSFVTNGGNTISPIVLNKTENFGISQPLVNKNGYKLEGWYTSSSFSEDSKFAAWNTKIETDLVLYAKWSLIDITPISSISEDQTYYRITGEVIGKRDNKTLYLHDESGEITYYASNSSEIDTISIGNTITICAVSSFYRNHIQLSGTPVDIVIESDDKGIETIPLTSIDDVSVDNFGKYIKLDRVQLTTDLESGTNKFAFINDIDDFYIYGQTSYTIKPFSTINAGKYINLTGVINVDADLVTPTIVLTSVELIKEYKATYHLDGGTLESNVTEQIVLENDKYINPGIPTKASDVNGTYTFEGWYSDPSFNNKYDFSKNANSDIDLYAHYIVGDLPYIDRFKYSETSVSLSYSYNKIDKSKDVDIEHNVAYSYSSTDFNSSDSEIVLENDIYSVIFSKGNYSSNIALDNTYFKFYSGNEFSINLKNKEASITKIVLNTTSSYAKNTTAYIDDYPIVATKDSTHITISIPNDYSTNELRVVNSDAGQSRINGFTLYYSVAGQEIVSEYSYSDVAIRFGGLVDQVIWNGLGNVEDYGVYYALSSSLTDTTLTEWLNNDFSNDELEEAGIYHTSIVEKKGEYVEPVTAKSSQLPKDKTGDYYIYNLYIPITKDQNFKENITAVAYVIVDGEMYLMQERETSVVRLAGEYSEKFDSESAYNEAYEGSLAELSRM